MEKEQTIIKSVTITKGNHCTYDINYHIVFCPKYRKEVLSGQIKNDLKLIFKDIINKNNWKLIEVEVMPDHVHLFISAHPKFSPTNIVKKLKGISARLIFKKYPEFQKKEYWGKNLWSQSYYVGTAGVVTKEAIKKYIQANTQLNTIENSSNH